MVDFSTIVTLAPHLASASVALQDATRAMVTDVVGTSASDERVKYLWLHFLELIHRQSASGGMIDNLASLTVGSISMSGGASANAGLAGMYGSTIWGTLYVQATNRMYVGTAV